MRDPVELYEYPEEWVERAASREGLSEVRRKIESGLYILTEDGWLRRGVTTATTASAAVAGAILSTVGDVDEVTVLTPVGIEVKLKVSAENGFCVAKKFSGDHAFDKTDGVEIMARVKDEREIFFGKGIGVKRGKKAVSKKAMEQIRKNFEAASKKAGFSGGVLIEIPEGEKLSKETGNERVGVRGGISILGTTGFVEPWCKKLVETKAKIVKRYEKVAITTGREGFRYALRELKDFQPFVFGIYIDEGLREAEGEVVIVGKPALLIKWAVPEMKDKLIGGAKSDSYRKLILEKAKELNENVADVILI